MAREPASRSRRHWLRWTIRLGVVLSVLVCIVVALLWFYLERTAAGGKKQLAAAIAETDALDPRWRWEEIQEDLPRIPDSENSIHVITKLADSLGSWNPSEFMLQDGQLILEDWPVNRLLDQERQTLVLNVLRERERSLDLAISLKDYRRGRAEVQLAPDLISTILEYAQNCRLPIFLLEFDIERLLGERRPTEVSLRIHAMLHAGAALRYDPFIVSQIIRIAARTIAVQKAERLLAMAEVNDDDLRQLFSHFRLEQEEKLLLVGIRGERAGYNFLFENLESGRLSLADFLTQAANTAKSAPQFSLRFGSLIYRPRMYEDHAFMLVTMNEACDIAKLPLSKQPGAWKDWEHRLRAAKAVATVEEKRKLITCLLVPSLARVAIESLRDHARLSCVQLALAAERFRLAHKRWPKDLQELCPTYLKEVPIDPFDGKPLKFALREEGIVIYSVDKDGKDDGGDIHKHSPDDDDPKDIGVRLWNPDHRRLPPEPKKKAEPKDES